MLFFSSTRADMPHARISRANARIVDLDAGRSVANFNRVNPIDAVQMHRPIRDG